LGKKLVVGNSKRENWRWEQKPGVRETDVGAGLHKVGGKSGLARIRKPVENKLGPKRKKRVSERRGEPTWATKGE